MTANTFLYKNKIYPHNWHVAVI